MEALDYTPCDNSKWLHSTSRYMSLIDFKNRPIKIADRSRYPFFIDHCVFLCATCFILSTSTKDSSPDQHQLKTAHRTFGELCYACCEGLAGISFVEALYRILNFVGQRFETLGAYCEKTASNIFELIMTRRTACVELPKSKVNNSQASP